MAAVVALYAAGMVLNDVCDVELDRRERPERPLPSGDVSVAAAALAGVALLAAGVALWPRSWPGRSVRPGRRSSAAGLAAAVWLYDRHAKGTPARAGGDGGLPGGRLAARDDGGRRPDDAPSSG